MRLHVLKYVAIPIVTMVGLQFGILIAFAVVTESIFAWPGDGGNSSSTRSTSSTGR